MKTYCFGNEMELEVIPEKDGVTDVEWLKERLDGETACVYIQHPNYYGNLEPAEEIGEIVHEAGGKYIMGVNPISLGMLKTPGEYGADVAVGEGQPLGLPLAFGGPYLGFMACVAGHDAQAAGQDRRPDEGPEWKDRICADAAGERAAHPQGEGVQQHLFQPGALCALAVGSLPFLHGE